jgi:hypothetical protein
MIYIRKQFFGPYHGMAKFLEGISQKVMGAFPKRLWGRNKFSMLVQESTHIDTTISKCLSLIITNFSKSTPLLYNYMQYCDYYMSYMYMVRCRGKKKKRVEGSYIGAVLRIKTVFDRIQIRLRLLNVRIQIRILT